jgi:DNA-binding CsgD family transcriptional regulator
MPLYESRQLKDYLSGIDAITLLEIIHKGLSCKTEEDFTVLFPKIQELFAFDFAGVLLGHHDNGNSLVITHGVNISFHEEWLREYLSKNYFYSDVATKETFRTSKLKHWSYLTMDYVNKVPKEIVSLNMDFGVKEAYFHGGSTAAAWINGSTFCFASPLMKQDNRTIAILEFLTPHLHLALSNIFNNKNSNINDSILTNREKEVLNWLKQGKSSWDISVILGISERTVNFHVHNIMQKLEAVNRTQAIAVATSMGLIDIG